MSLWSRSSQMKQLLLDAIGSLPRPERTVYELRDLEDTSGAETAAKLGISLAAVKSRLHRARGKVRSYLDAALAPQKTPS